MITGLKVTTANNSFKFNSNCLAFQARVLSGISMAVSKDPKIQNQFTLETLLSEKLSSKYQVSFLSSVLYSKVSRESWWNFNFILLRIQNMKFMEVVPDVILSCKLLLWRHSTLKVYHPRANQLSLFSWKGKDWWIINISFAAPTCLRAYFTARNNIFPLSEFLWRRDHGTSGDQVGSASQIG